MHAKKSFGQNFLVDQRYIDKIIKVLDPRPEDLIFEIGPGQGAITERVVELAGKVVAIELDRDLIPVLQRKFAGSDNLTIVQEDALSTDFCQLKGSYSRPAKLVANLPYYISTAVLQRLALQRDEFSEMILMFQREVVDRITAFPGSSERGFLTVYVEAFVSVEKLFDVPPSAFRPVPKVTSSVVRVKPIPADAILFGAEAKLRRLLSSAFRQKRKTILNNLRADRELTDDAAGLLERAAIDPKRRAETLDLAEWKRIYDLLGATQP